MFNIGQELRKDIDSLRSRKGYLNAGIPRFEGLFGRDSAISAWQLLDYDRKIAESTLTELARLQGKKFNAKNREEPGKIIHEYYPADTDITWMSTHKGGVKWLKLGVPVYFSVDSTPLFIILYVEHYNKYKDLKFSKALLPNVKSAADWIIDYGIVDGLLRYTSCESPEKGLLSQSWKDGIGNVLESVKSPAAIIEVQGYAYRALKSLASIITELDKDYETERLTEAANLIKSNLHRLWMDDKGYYALGVDGDNVQIGMVASNPGQLLFTGILEKEKADLVVKRLFKRQMFTKYGIRTHSSDEAVFDEYAYQRGSVWQHDNWIIAMGLKSMGYDNEYKMVRDSILFAFKEIKSAPEYYGVSRNGELIESDKMKTTPCVPQAWSAGAILNLLSTV